MLHHIMGLEPRVLFSGTQLQLDHTDMGTAFAGNNFGSFNGVATPGGEMMLFGNQGILYAEKFGTTFANPVQISPEGQTINASDTIGKATTADGHTWISYSANVNNVSQIFVAQIDSDGHTTIPPFQVDTGDSNGELQSSVAVDPTSGNVLVTWVRGGGLSGQESVMGKIFSSSGISITDDVQLSPGLTGNTENLRSVLSSPSAVFNPVTSQWNIVYHRSIFDASNNFQQLSEEIMTGGLSPTGTPESSATAFSKTDPLQSLGIPMLVANSNGSEMVYFDAQKFTSNFDFAGSTINAVDLGNLSAGPTVIDSTSALDQEFLVLAAALDRPEAPQGGGVFVVEGTPGSSSAFVPLKTSLIVRDGTITKSSVNLPAGASEPVVFLNNSSGTPQANILSTVQDNAGNVTPVDQVANVTNDTGGGTTASSHITGSFSFSSDLSFLSPGGEIFLPEITLSTDDANPNRFHGKGGIEFVLVGADNKTLVIGAKNISIKFNHNSHTYVAAKKVSVKIPDDLPAGTYTLQVSLDGARNLPSDVTVSDNFSPEQGVNTTLSIQSKADAKHKTTTTDADGTKTSVTIKGPGQAQVIDNNGTKSIAVTGSTSKTQLTITPTTGGNGRADIADINSSSPLGTINAPKADISGSVHTGGTNKATLGNVKDNHVIDLGSAGAAVIVMGDVASTDLTAGDIKSLTVNSWSGGSITAGNIKTLSDGGDLDADISANSIQTLKIVGALGGASSSSMRNIRIATNVGTATLGSIRNANFFVAMPATATALPTSQSAFTSTSGSVKSFITGGYQNTDLAAPIFGNIVINGLVSTNTNPFGIVGDSVKSYKRGDVIKANVFSPQVIDSVDQYTAQAV